METKSALAFLSFLALAACATGDGPVAAAPRAAQSASTAASTPGAAPGVPVSPDGTGEGIPEREATLALPATFRGVLPCADCEGIAHHLDLWPDQVFHLRQEYLGREGTFDDIGRWRRHPSRPVIRLYGGREMPLAFEVLAPDRIRKLDLQGRPIESALDYDLVSEGRLEATEVSLPMSGLFTYLADAPGFQTCLTGRFYPVLMEGAYIDLERAYLATGKPEPGAPLLVNLEGTIAPRPAMEGDTLVPTLIVRRFIGIWPDHTCERFMANASLSETYWKLLTLDDEAVHAVEERREPHLILRRDASRYSATVGCNQLAGGYEVGGENISFGLGISTLMACPPPLDDLERRFKEALVEVRRWAIHGQGLELFDEDGSVRARFEAVYLP